MVNRVVLVVRHSDRRHGALHPVADILLGGIADVGRFGVVGAEGGIGGIPAEGKGKKKTN